mmetsp:Transcript_14967/g.22420  ORF Transcript_14967/g.22420 Transcript_14967/m.22420 type:complete len:322 (+) Transcript_14967:117-1082(+)
MNTSTQKKMQEMGQFEIGEDDTKTDIFVGTGPLDSEPNGNNNISLQSRNSNINSGQQNTPPPTTWYGRIFACFQTASLQEFFDVDTVDIKLRIISSVRHCNNPDIFRESILYREGTRPDLYGPVWVFMTLVLFLAATSNTSKYLHTDAIEEFEYDISHLVHAFTVLLFYTFGLPFLIYMMLQCVGVSGVPSASVNSNDNVNPIPPLSLIDYVCIYGYSLVPYLPMTVLCLVPSVMLEWMFLLTATGMSLLLVLRNLVGPIMRQNSQWLGPVTMFLISCHFIFCLVLKFTFYHRKFLSGGSSKESPHDTDDGNFLTDDEYLE